MRQVIPEPLTADAFAQFGDVIEASDRAEVLPINYGWTTRFNALTDVAVGDGQAIISIFRSKPLTPPILKIFERHPLGSQAFYPLTDSPWLVIVAEDEGGTPTRLRAFRPVPGQGVNIAMNTWHGVLTPFNEPQEFLVVDRGGDGSNLEEFFFVAPWEIHLPGMTL